MDLYRLYFARLVFFGAVILGIWLGFTLRSCFHHKEKHTIVIDLSENQTPPALTFR
ncbi:MAG: hypothetical protein IJY58_05640 [Alphaproteobacteria bacterium]|nr:hypothetical protein [Alphaproteobacteria bacterium]